MKLYLGLFLHSVAFLAVMSRRITGATDEDYSTISDRKDIHILLYESDPAFKQDSSSSIHFFKERSNTAKLHTTVFGGKLQNPGFGDKLQLLKPLLEVADPDQLIVVAGAREVALNVPNNEGAATQAVDRFLETFHRLTEATPGAVVLSTEDVCCSAAMSHAAPGDYFDADTGTRKERACSSGSDDCSFEDNDNIVQWKQFMKQMALVRTVGNEEHQSVYLNSGIVAGYPQDLIKMLDLIDLQANEDDQAVLSGLMYSFSDTIALDYHQELFGNNQVGSGAIDGCLFEQHDPHSPLYHVEKKSQPLILHTPGRFYQCLDVLIELLGGKSQQRYLRGTR